MANEIPKDLYSDLEIAMLAKVFDVSTYTIVRWWWKKDDRLTTDKAAIALKQINEFVSSVFYPKSTYKVK